MARTVKDPEERRSELLACAMRLFDEEGYDNVSVRAVARAAGVAPALAYHYFDSKEKLFDEAVRAYARRCADGFIAVDRAVELAGTHDFPHAGAFHGGGAGALHDRLSLALCEEVRPHLAAALECDAAARGMAAADAGALAGMMVYGCIGLASGPGMPDAAAMSAARRYLGALIAAFRSPHQD